MSQKVFTSPVTLLDKVFWAGFFFHQYFEYVIPLSWPVQFFLKNLLMGFNQFSSVLFSRSVMSDSLQPHGLQHARPPCPSPTPRAYSNSCPSSRLCHQTIFLCHHFLLLPSIFPNIRVFSNKSVLHIEWPKYWSFSFQHHYFQ